MFQNRPLHIPQEGYEKVLVKRKHLTFIFLGETVASSETRGLPELNVSAYKQNFLLLIPLKQLYSANIFGAFYGFWPLQSKETCQETLSKDGAMGRQSLHVYIAIA